MSNHLPLEEEVMNGLYVNSLQAAVEDQAGRSRLALLERLAAGIHLEPHQASRLEVLVVPVDLLPEEDRRPHSSSVL